MNAKERLRAALDRKNPDQTPVMILDGGAWVAGLNDLTLAEFMALEDGGASLIMDTFTRIDSDVLMVAVGYFLWPLAALGAEHNYTRPKSTGDVGALLADISDVNDLSVEQVIDKLRNDKVMLKMVKQTKQVAEANAGEKYILAAIAAPFTYAGTMLGVENYMVELMTEENPDEMEKINEISVAIAVEFANMLHEAGADGVILCDPVASGDLLSQEMYEEYALPLTKKAFEELGSLELRFLHICGNSQARVKSLLELPLDAFSCDSINLAQALLDTEGQFAIVGDLSPHGVVERQTPETIIERSKERIAEAKQTDKNGGYIICPGCDVTAITPFENVKALMQSAKG